MRFLPLFVLGSTISIVFAQLRNVTIDDQSSLFRYSPSGSWEEHDDGGTGWDSGGGHRVTADPDAVASINYTFVNFDFVSALYPFAVKTNIFVDGAFFQTVDLQDYNSVDDGSGQSTVRAAVLASYRGRTSRTRSLSLSMTPGETLAAVDAIIFEVSSSGGGGSNTARNVGIALGVAIPILLAVIAFFLWRQYRRRQSKLNGNVHTMYPSTPYSPQALPPIPLSPGAYDQEKGSMTPSPRLFPDPEKRNANVVVANVPRSPSSPHSPPLSPPFPPPPPIQAKASVSSSGNPFEELAQGKKDYFSTPASQPPLPPIPVPGPEENANALATPPKLFSMPVQQKENTRASMKPPPKLAQEKVPTGNGQAMYSSTPSSPPSSPRILPPPSPTQEKQMASNSTSIPPPALAAFSQTHGVVAPPKPFSEPVREMENQRTSAKPSPRPVQEGAQPSTSYPPPSSPPVPASSQATRHPVGPLQDKVSLSNLPFGHPPPKKEQEREMAPTATPPTPLPMPETKKKKKKETTVPKFKFFRKQQAQEKPKEEKYTLAPPSKMEDIMSDSRSDVGIVGSSAPVAPTPPPEPSDWDFAPAPLRGDRDRDRDMAGEVGAGAAGVGAWRRGKSIASLKGPPASYTVSPNTTTSPDANGRMMQQHQPSAPRRRMSWNDAAMAVVGSPPPSASPLPPPT